MCACMCEMLYIRVCVFVNVCVCIYIYTQSNIHIHTFGQKKLILAPKKCFKRKEIVAEKFVEKKFQLKINFGTKMFRQKKYAKKKHFSIIKHFQGKQIFPTFSNRK